MTGIYSMELENIRERTMMGRIVYVQNGGILGRPSGTNESENEFLRKEKSQQIIKGIRKGLTIREISAVTRTSTRTVQKLKTLSKKHSLLVSS
ncbi:MAG: recombinase family protein [Sphingobacteriaceae bacterium]|nr:recombinase family protein [Sphingobacteriaceae bacterium]